ncbi:unannotated protein [freshwater metagenome]|uniref:Unannotated protein n=1 Tax=freshwater metagenome TaxID=449393 RepID=A0A6J6DBQ9_9ZZZZ
MVMRSNSVSLPTKCLIQLATPLDCTPLTYSTAISAVNNGSSLMHSKLRPPTGVRCKFTVGARCTRAPLAISSRPSNSPTSRITLGSHVAASAVPHGTFMDAGPSKREPRTPAGPSLTRSLGMSNRGMGTVFHIFDPASKDTCSSTVSSARSFSTGTEGRTSGISSTLVPSLPTPFKPNWCP